RFTVPVAVEQLLQGLSQIPTGDNPAGNAQGPLHRSMWQLTRLAGAETFGFGHCASRAGAALRHGLRPTWADGTCSAEEPTAAIRRCGVSKLVYDFAEGRKDMADLLGGKGANLSAMSNLGLPVPPGFTITTEACRVYLTTGTEPDELWTEVDEHLDQLQRTIGKVLGDSADPLLVSVR